MYLLKLFKHQRTEYCFYLELFVMRASGCTVNHRLIRIQDYSTSNTYERIKEMNIMINSIRTDY